MIPSNPEQDPYESPKGSKPAKEIWRLLEYLMAAAPLSAGVWTESVNTERVWSILDHLDTGSDISPGQSNDVAQCLITVLGWIPGSLVGNIAITCVQVKARDEAFAAIEELEQVNTNVSVV